MTTINLGFSGSECTHWVGGDFCRSTQWVRPYGSGPRCSRHSPAALLGEPEPDEMLARAKAIRGGLAEVTGA